MSWKATAHKYNHFSGEWATLKINTRTEKSKLKAALHTSVTSEMFTFSRSWHLRLLPIRRTERHRGRRNLQEPSPELLQSHQDSSCLFLPPRWWLLGWRKSSSSVWCVQLKLKSLIWIFFSSLTFCNTLFVTFCFILKVYTGKMPFPPSFLLSNCNSRCL